MYNTDTQQFTDVTIHKFTELQKFQKAAFLSQEVAINILIEVHHNNSDFDDYSNEKWKEWQKI